MDYDGEPSRLFQDLLTLEKDFKYNLSLLKVKDTEIERCSITNNTLQDTLKAKLGEVEELRSKVSKLEEALQKSENGLAREKLICQQRVAKLVENLDDMTQKLQKRLDDSESETRIKHAELEKVYARVLAQKEKEYQQNIEAVETRLQKEICSTSKTKSRLETLADENMSLRNKIRQLESQYTSETYFYKSEFETLQSTNSNLNSEIECLKESLASAEGDFTKMTLENDNLRRELSVNTDKISNLIKQINEGAGENNELGKLVEEKENLYKGLILDNGKLTRENNQLTFECNDLKRIVEEYSSCNFCHISSHNNYDVLAKQNAVLQDLVKAMRRERERHMEENSETERRVEKLEELMYVLKQHYV